MDGYYAVSPQDGVVVVCTLTFDPVKKLTLPLDSLPPADPRSATPAALPPLAPPLPLSPAHLPQPPTICLKATASFTFTVP